MAESKIIVAVMLLGNVMCDHVMCLLRFGKGNMSLTSAAQYSLPEPLLNKTRPIWEKSFYRELYCGVTVLKSCKGFSNMPSYQKVL